MESQPQNPEFRNNPENFHPCIALTVYTKMTFSWDKVQNVQNLEIQISKLEVHRTRVGNFINRAAGSAAVYMEVEKNRLKTKSISFIV